MNGPDVNLVGCLVFCGAAKNGEDLQELHLKHFKNRSKETPLKFNSEFTP